MQSALYFSPLLRETCVPGGWGRSLLFMLRSPVGVISQPVQDAVVELFLVGEADIVVTSPKSSFSVFAAATGGESTQRVGKSDIYAIFRSTPLYAGHTSSSAPVEIVLPELLGSLARRTLPHRISPPPPTFLTTLWLADTAPPRAQQQQRNHFHLAGMSCKAIVNEPEFHMLECAVGRHALDATKWKLVYPSLTDSNRARCNSRRRHRR